MSRQPARPPQPHGDGSVSITNLQPGQVVWAYARHAWRQVRVVSKGRTRVSIAFWIHERGTLMKQTVTVWDLSLERPRYARANVMNEAAPSELECGLGGEAAS